MGYMLPSEEEEKMGRDFCETKHEGARLAGELRAGAPELAR